MKLPKLNQAEGQLLRKIGPGRQLELLDGVMTFTYGMGGGDGLIVHAEVLNQPVRFWIAAAHWCRWVRPMLDVPHWSAVPPELHDVLASWTLASAGAGLADSAVAWPTATTLEAAKVEAAPHWCLCFAQEDRQLQAWVLEAPLQWLDSLSQLFQPMDTQHASDRRTLPVALIAGWSPVDRSTLERLQPGDALLLQHAYRATEGQVGLFLSRPLATLSAPDVSTFTLETIMDDFNDWLDIAPGPAAADSPLGSDLLVTVVAQLGSLDVPLHQLAHLQVGDVLQGPARIDDCVTLKVAGKPLAHGLLLEIDGRLAVRIDRLC
ncbi:type III secretion system cytoplasmic ring protein SctQ [Pseudomonas sp. 681]|uniref:Type III secretion system cytoplasmic ring protein SctQ n=1 Tax=Pseudomonas fungipugnans TaxID=3024217 RepID=A0ABT6QHT0_9PSED|nr:type III secretion system cytoplasmic ring protein SctQ [Pseudomonas sp. 681]MDI2590448.1 type III secretion system cytoplasmic ring protein SctQ [Pseudomonas sp. 681]